MFVLSVILIIISSYLITSLITANRNKHAFDFLYFILISYAQIVLTFEILSLFNAIQELPFFIINITVFIIFLIICTVKKCIKNPFNGSITEIKKIINAIKRDPILLLLSFCFIVFLISQLAVITKLPINSGDTLAYYLPRATTWIQQANINHFYTSDIRELIMPINMDLLYTYVLMFRRNEFGIGIFSFISYICAIYTIYNILAEIGFCRRKRLWTIYVFSSFAILDTMIHNPVAEVCCGSLMLICIYLYLTAVKYQDKSALYFASLACALGVGTKTPALISMPSVLIILLIISILYGNKKFKPYIYFGGFLIINFFIFSGYNYISNFIEFHNPISSPQGFIIHQFNGGLKEYLCTLIKYIFAIFDFSGIENIDFYNNFITKLQSYALKLIGETPNSYMTNYFKDNFEFNSEIGVTVSGLGVMGLLAFLPCLIFAFFKKKSKRYCFLSALALTFIFNILLFSGVMIYTKFNLRLIFTFVVIASPILVLSYIKSNKNLYKLIMCVFAAIYLFTVSVIYPLFYAVCYNKYKLINSTSLNEYAESINAFRDERIYNYFTEEENDNKYNIKIAVISQKPYKSVYDIEKLKLKGYRLDKYPIDDLKNYNLTDYDYIIASDNTSSTTNIKNFDNPDCTYINRKYEENEENEEIKENTKSTPALAKCIVPFDFLYEQGFQTINDLDIGEYKILKKTIK